MKSTLLNDGWEFALDGSDFAPVALPHDWLIHDTENLYKNGIGRYRRYLNTDSLQSGQRLFINFDGVYMYSTFYVNEKKAGEWKYGYTAFEFEITDYLAPNGENTLLMEVNHQSPNSRWYSGAGIYRDVSLKVKNACHFITDGIYVTTAKKDGNWSYTATAEVETGGKAYELRHSLYETGSPRPIENGSDKIKTWDINSPQLYTLVSELIVDGAVCDTVQTRFGFREIAFDTKLGFSLNGRRMKLYGACMHHDLGALGSAMDKDALRRQFDLLRGMGVNAIRTSHNPPARVFMELADEMGFLIMSELLDMWELPKTTYDYARFFGEWVERDLASWVRRDRNCPSVIMWSVGNEIYDTHVSAERGGTLLKMLSDLVKTHDPNGHAPVTFSSNYMEWENTQKCVDIIKLIGYNYAERLYNDHHQAHPDWIIYGGEVASHVQSRGVYRFPLRQSVLADDDLQCSSLGNCNTSWGAQSAEICALADEQHPFSLGLFIWTGMDYIGEPTPYHTKNSYFGQIDTAGFFKDSYHVYKAAWTKEPMVHLFPYWDYSPGQIIDVRAATNAHAAELFFEGQSLGRVELGERYIADWSVTYKPGELTVLAYDEAGAVVAKDSRRSFGDTATLKLDTEVYGKLHFVTISAEDTAGNAVENAADRIHVRVTDGELLGLDNGDSSDFEQYKCDNRRLFNGKLLAIVRRTGDKAPTVEAQIDKSDVAIRKIEITLDDLTATAKIFPENATYDDLEWRLTDAAGIDSLLGTLDVAADARSAQIIPKGDGEMWLRCAARNGREHVVLISQLSLTVSGYGKPLIDPYTFVTGGLANRSNVELANGNERGIVSGREGESHVGYADLDFGSFGSDELNVPLFPLSHDPFNFEVWEGMPGEPGARRLTTYIYDLGQIWNTYQDVHVKLPRRLKGVTTLCFVFYNKVHIKGFVFERKEKAFARLYAAENDGISGDTFSIKEQAVEGIGNNVSIIFRDMDFGEKGADSVCLCTRSAQAINSVQLLIDGQREMLEIAGTAAYSATTHALGERVYGKKTVTLIFLPGTDIDLEWISFS